MSREQKGGPGSLSRGSGCPVEGWPTRLGQAFLRESDPNCEFLLLLFLRSLDCFIFGFTGSVAAGAFCSCGGPSPCSGVSGCGARTLVPRLSSRSKACGIFPKQEWSLCCLHWLADS